MTMTARSNTNKAFAVGISDYSSPHFGDLPAVAADVREIAKLLQSRQGSFTKSNVAVLTDRKATRAAILAGIKEAFTTTAKDQTTFVYLAGHGHVENDQYFFVSRDFVLGDMASTAVPLRQVKRLFDKCESERVFLWLDCCHSGGIMKPRRGAVSLGKEVLSRELRAVKGNGKVIIAACTEDQSAFESPVLGHGFFTHALLRGLRGEAEYLGEISATSLFAFVVHEVDNPNQSPMLFCQSKGNIVLMHDPSRKAKPKAAMPDKLPAKSATSTRVSASGNWVMLGDEFFEAKRVGRKPDGNIQVEVVTRTAEEDAAVRQFRPKQYHSGEEQPFAHRNEACDVTVENVASETTSRGHVWTLDLKPAEISHSMYDNVTYGENTPDDMATMRAEYILLNRKPKASGSARSIGYSMIDRVITKRSGSEIEPPIPAIYKSHGDKQWQQLARLKALYLLHSTGSVTDVLELTIGRVKGNSVPVSFRGQLPKRYSNSTPYIVEFAGDCPLN